MYPYSLHSIPPPVCLQAFLRILVPSKLYWRWWKGLLIVKLLLRGHFHINEVDKVGVGYLMWRGEVYPSGKFLPPSWPPSLLILLSLEHHKAPTVLIIFPSSGGQNPWSILITSSLDYANYSLVWSSSIFGPPTCIIYVS